MAFGNIEFYYWTFILLVGTIVFFFILFYKTNRERLLFKNQLFEPKLTLLTEENKELLLQIIPLLDHLSFDSKKFLITKLFGRPCRFITSQDVDGQQWLESVVYFTTNDEEDKNFHLEKYFEREGRGGVG